MTKSELVARMWERNPNLRQSDMEAALNTVLDAIADALSQGNRVELRGFGAFSAKHRPARRSRNPRTGEAVDVEDKHIPFFKAGRGILSRLNALTFPEPASRTE